MVHEINNVTLSGQVGFVKKKFTSQNKLYIMFTVKQKNFEIRDGQVVGTLYDTYFISCFDDVAVRLGNIKEDDWVFISGRISSYEDEKKKTTFSIIAEKVIKHGS